MMHPLCWLQAPCEHLVRRALSVPALSAPFTFTANFQPTWPSAAWEEDMSITDSVVAALVALVGLSVVAPALGA